ncbi:coenzyme Q biosynthesis protein Coq4-domain-containing protein [Xylaria bambusicola]|uniref:coenzyme Q biosynthesis protein Coq4-domain-containing protein n=1 Tax=Xylaria bambusicola TaxID=326684 RepID=UPI002008E7FF|nr:coenzyme Q biosynthesis protein Coq4-domain-containing protein [Xylaria bambusicola]KAI0509159.1 coenzyme Q biosynthesis protein Coq4-domain-containing protein [Xylaria bambusicola]
MAKMKALQPGLRSVRHSRNVTSIIPPRCSSPALLLPITSSSTSPCPQPTTSRSCSPSQTRPFSVLNRPPPNYPGHVPLTGIERAALAIGSGVLSFLDPRRGDLIAALGEATATPYFANRLRRAMLASPTGRRILRDRPRITSTCLDLPRLRALPPSTVGATYVAWLDREGVTPDTRAGVRYVDDEECAYVIQRYRESHDFYHALTGLPVVREGEVALKAFEFANTLLPMTGLSVLAVATLKPAERRRFWGIYGPWAVRNGLRSEEVINVYWEEELETDVRDLRARLNIEAPPDLRDIRKRERAEKKAAKEAALAAASAAGTPPAAAEKI